MFDSVTLEQLYEALAYNRNLMYNDVRLYEVNDMLLVEINKRLNAAPHTR